MSETIIISYPLGANGKFIINCLGLGDNAVLQDKNLALKKINNELDTLSELIHRLNQVEDNWNDLELGCFQLYGFNARHGETINNIVKEANALGYFTFIIAHDSDQINKLQTIFPTSKVIHLMDSDRWIHNFDVLADYVKSLYDEIGVTGFDIDAIKQYYTLYIQKLIKVNRI